MSHQHLATPLKTPEKAQISKSSFGKEASGLPCKLVLKLPVTLSKLVM
jgi:hypothetical protein